MRAEVGFSGERLLVIPSPFLELMRDDPLACDLYVCSLGHIAHARYHRIHRPEGEATYTFLYCTWGKGRVTIRERQMELGPNQHIVLPKDVPLFYEADENDPWSIYWVKFDGEKGALFARNMAEPTTVLPSVFLRAEQRIELFEELYAMLCGELSLEKLEYANIVFTHFIASFRFFNLFRSADEPPRYAEGMVNRVLHFMNENLERHLTLDEIARWIGYSKSYFYRQFIR